MPNVPQARNSQEFHRRRAEVEMDRALTAKQPSVAMLHLELARKHREERDRMLMEDRARLRANPPRLFNRTDKEC